MKIRITMKDPDGIYDSILDTLRPPDVTVDDIMEDMRFRDIFEYGEYLTVEYDTETGHAVVLDSEGNYLD